MFIATFESYSFVSFVSWFAWFDVFFRGIGIDFFSDDVFQFFGESIAGVQVTSPLHIVEGRGEASVLKVHQRFQNIGFEVIISIAY